MVRCLILLVGWLLLAVPALGEPPVTPKAGEPMPDVWGDVPEFIASDRGYNGLRWMSVDYMRDGDGRIQWEQLDPDEVDHLKKLARNNSRKIAELSSDSETCQTFSFTTQEYSPGRNFSRLVERATHIISGAVIDFRQGFSPSATASTIYQIQPDVTFKGEPLETPFLASLQMARIQTTEGLICIGVQAPDQGPPVTGTRVVMFLSDARIWGGVWSVPNAAVFYENPDGSVSKPFTFKDVKSLDDVEEAIIKEMRGTR